MGELCCEETLQTINILNIVEAFGFDLKYEKNIGPVINNKNLSLKNIKKLNELEAINNLEYTFNNIKLIKRELKNIPLIGFAGSPWTVACYIVEGYSTKKFTTIR